MERFNPREIAPTARFALRSTKPMTRVSCQDIFFVKRFQTSIIVNESLKNI